MNFNLRKKMSYLLIVAAILVVAYMVINHRPVQPSVEEMSQWFSTKLDELSTNADADILLEKQGHYRHKGMQHFASVGSITYDLLDKSYARFEL